MNATKKAEIALDLALTIWDNDSASANDLNDIRTLIEKAYNELKGAN